ncbi:MAG TPA: hypothetical protein DCS15_01510, partial [Flavobacteriales bacterium]|nr:hypothetical protein [Flavobacteriales bacterium]
ACVPDAIQRSVYIQATAARIKLPEDLLQAEVAKEIQKRQFKAVKRSAQTQTSQTGYPSSGPAPSAPLPGTEYPTQNVSGDLAPGIPARVRTKRDMLEDTIIKLLLEHGDVLVNVEIESDQIDEGADSGETKEVAAPTSFTEVPFAELLVHRIETHNLEMENDSTNYILSRYKQSLDAGTLPSTKSFFTDTSPEIQTRAANMLVNKYSLSENWANKHHIFSIREEEVLEQALSSATTRLLLFDVQRNIDTVIKALSSKGISDEEVNRLLREKIKLDRIVKDLNLALGVVILPK